MCIHTSWRGEISSELHLATSIADIVCIDIELCKTVSRVMRYFILKSDYSIIDCERVS